MDEGDVGDYDFIDYGSTDHTSDFGDQDLVVELQQAGGRPMKIRVPNGHITSSRIPVETMWFLCVQVSCLVPAKSMCVLPPEYFDTVINLGKTREWKNPDTHVICIPTWSRKHWSLFVIVLDGADATVYYFNALFLEDRQANILKMEQFLRDVGYCPTTIEKTRSHPKDYSIYVINVVLMIVKLLPVPGSMNDKIKSFKFCIYRTRGDLSKELQSARDPLFGQACIATRSFKNKGAHAWPCRRIGFHFANGIEPCPSSMEAKMIPISWIDDKPNQVLCEWVCSSQVRLLNYQSAKKARIGHPDPVGFDVACKLAMHN
jgi:hypothetical protein